MSNGMLLLVFFVLMMGLLPTMIAIVAALRESDPLDERQVQIRSRAYRDAVIVLLSLSALGAFWLGLRNSAGIPVLVRPEGPLYLITMTGFAFYMADCIVRNIAFGRMEDKDRKKTLRNLAFSFAFLIAIGLPDVVRGEEPFFVFLQGGFVILDASMTIACIIRMILDKKEENQEGTEDREE